MYYEETWIGDSLFWRSSPNGKWNEFTIADYKTKVRQLEQQVKSVGLADVGGSLPDPYEGDLNAERIAEYRKLKPLYALDGGSIRDLFCAGIDWYKKVLERQ